MDVVVDEMSAKIFSGMENKRYETLSAVGVGAGRIWGLVWQLGMGSTTTEIFRHTAHEELLSTDVSDTRLAGVFFSDTDEFSTDVSDSAEGRGGRLTTQLNCSRIVMHTCSMLCYKWLGLFKIFRRGVLCLQVLRHSADYVVC